MQKHNHLIDPHSREDGPVNAKSYFDELGAAHDAIIARAAGWTAPPAGPRWGIAAKRQLVNLADAHPSVHGSHPINELMNLCATVERLLDALEWGMKKGWATSVIECHPTTSSSSVQPTPVAAGVPVPGPPDLLTEGALGKAWFEVSDVLKVRDGNRKLQKDLQRLRGAPTDVTAFLVGSGLWQGRVDQLGFDCEKERDTLIAQVSLSTG